MMLTAATVGEGDASEADVADGGCGCYSMDRWVLVWGKVGGGGFRWKVVMMEMGRGDLVWVQMEMDDDDGEDDGDEDGLLGWRKRKRIGVRWRKRKRIGVLR